MIFRTPIKTSRILLRNESPKDFERYFSMSVDPEVMKYIGDGSIFHWTKDVALEKFTKRYSRQDDSEYGNLSVYREDRDLYIGWCGVCYSRFLDHIELSYRYCSDSWNRGYATEAASAIIKEAYQVTDLDEIHACT
ncbi:GNAT family N-acetyltransferase, partial [Thermodesulfobacteriota bacterium]